MDHPDPTPPSDTSPPVDLVDRLLLECMDHPQSSWDIAVGAACAAHPDLAFALRARLAALRRLGELLPPSDQETGSLQRVGPYRLVRPLGSGGMGEVWLAEHAELGRRVALKLVRREFLTSPAAQARFAREAVAATRLDHPGICPVHEVGTDGDRAFLAMRYLEGETLADRLARARSAPASSARAARREAVDETLHQFERLAAALQAAHDHGLVHRDIKPGNVFLTAQGEVILLDFGLARVAEDAGPTLTVTGDQLGTPAYMPPEQVRGESSRVDHRADVYSLGVSLFEALTGRRPFEHADREQLYQQILRAPPPDPLGLRPGLPPELRPVLQKALEKDPRDRFATIAEFGEQLRRIRLREPITVRGIGPWLRTRRWTQRNPVAATAIGMLSAGLVAALFAVRMLLEQSEELRAQTGRARASALASDAIATVAVDPRRALGLALQACDLDASSLGLTALQAAMAHQHELRRLEVEEVAEAIWSPADLQTIATRDLSEKVFLWKLAHDPAERIELDGDGTAVLHAFAFSPDGELVATARRDGRVRLFGAGDGALRWQSPALGPGAAPTAIAFDPRSAGAEVRIAAAIADPPTRSAHVRIWELPGGGSRESPAEMTSRVTGFLPTCAFADTETLVFCAATAAFVWHLDGDRVDRLDFQGPAPLLAGAQPGGGVVLAFGRDGFAAVHGRDGGLLRAVRGHQAGAGVRTAAAAPDGAFVLTGGEDGLVLLTDVETGACTPLPGHAARPTCTEFSADGRLALTATTRGVIRLFDRSGELLLRIEGHGAGVRSARFSPDGSRILSAGLDDSVRIWSVMALGPPTFRGHANAVVDAAFSSDGQTIATVSADRTLRAWRAAGGSAGPVIELDEVANALSFAPGRTDRVAVVSRTRVDLVDLSTGAIEAIAEVSGSRNHAHRGLAWTADGAQLFTFACDNDGTRSAVRAWARRGDGRWEERWRAPGLPRCHAFALAPDGREVLLGCYDGVARVFTVEGWQERATFRHGEELTAVGWSAGGSRIHTLSRVASEVVKVWSRSGGDPVVLVGHPQQPTHAAFSPSGEWVATGAADGSVRIWRVADGAPAMTIGAHDGIVHAVAWSPDGRFVLSAASDRMARLWYANGADLQREARALLDRR